MKKLIIISLLFLLVACSSMTEQPSYAQQSESFRIYDENGDFAGHIDGTYRVYDREGNFIGMIRR